MDKIRLGRTNLMASRTAFGALPIQRRTIEDAIPILHRAYEAGVNYFDTARAYSDSEEKLGLAFPPEIRKDIIIATKTTAIDADGFWEQLEISLNKLKTEYIDVYQFHNPTTAPLPGENNGLYDAMLKARRQGKIRHISITSHKLLVAKEAVLSGLYDTLQFPFSLLAGEIELELVELCRQKDIGFIAMKALSGGLLTDARTAFAFMRVYENVLPIWGIQHMHELDEFIGLENSPPIFDEMMKKSIEHDRAALSGDFCRGCGYCGPCPANIEIQTEARIYFLATRAPYQQFLSDDFQKKMARAENCTGCGACKQRCPYELDTPRLVAKQYELYKDFVKINMPSI